MTFRSKLLSDKIRSFAMHFSITYQSGGGRDSLMSDWTERLLGEVSNSNELNQQKHTRQQYIVEKRKALQDSGHHLWDEFVKTCRDSVETLNAKITAKFPHGRSQKVTMEMASGISFILFGSDPPFSMAVTYNAGDEEFTISGWREIDRVRDQRQAALKLDFDEEGNTCLKLADHKTLLSDASIYLLELGMASTPPKPPR
jgi:hypothetical protein